MGFPVSDTITFEKCLFEAHFLPTNQNRSNNFGKEYVNQRSFVWKLVKVQGRKWCLTKNVDWRWTAFDTRRTKTGQTSSPLSLCAQVNLTRYLTDNMQQPLCFSSIEVLLPMFITYQQKMYCINDFNHLIVYIACATSSLNRH